MEQNLQLEFDAIIKNVVIPFFKELGFKKNGNTFNRNTDELTQVVSVQKSQWNSKEKVSFTVNIGFFDPEIYLEKSKKVKPKFIREYDCQLRLRLGHITKNHDYWYELNYDTNFENLKIEIYNDLTNSLAPILHRIIDLNSIKYIILNESNINLTIPNIYKIKFLLKTEERKKGQELLEKEYFCVLNPEDYISKTIYPDGTEIIKKSKSAINIKYLETLKEIAKENNLTLDI